MKARLYVASRRAGPAFGGRLLLRQFFASKARRRDWRLPMTSVPTTIRQEGLTLPMARLGRPSNMPRFRWQQPMPNRETPPNFGLSEEESRHGFNWGEDTILPYQVSDDYDREVRPGQFDVVVIDNGRLRAVVAPSLGGRLLELKDLATGRDLVFRNPVIQPANLAALNALFSGGIVWNGLTPGHT